MSAAVIVAAASISGLPIWPWMTPVLPWIAALIILGIVLGALKKAWPLAKRAAAALRRILDLAEDLSRLGGALRDISAVKDDVATVKQEVKNSHVTNLRHDIDNTHRQVVEVTAKVDTLTDEVRASREEARDIHKTNGEQWAEIARLQRRDDKHP